MRVLILDDPAITALDLINGEWDVVICSYEFLHNQYTALGKTEADVASFVKGNHRGAKPVSYSCHEYRIASADANMNR